MANLIERHREKIAGVLSCFDRLVLQGTLPSVAYPQAVASELDRRDIRIFDYAKQFALPFRGAIRARTEHLAAEEGVEIQYIQRMKTFRKEDRIQQILAVRGNRPGLGACAAKHSSKMALLRCFLSCATVCKRLHAPIGTVREGNPSIEKLAPHIES